MVRQIVNFSLAIATLWFVSHSASAAIMYGDFDDIPPGVVMYTDVTESSATDPVPPPRFGAPTIVVNDLDFDPMDFGATAPIGPSTADLTDVQLNFGFATLPGRGLSGLAVNESGDFTLFGSGDATTSVAAGIYAEIEITHVDQTPLVSPITVVGSTQFSTNLESSPGLNQPWGQTLLVDFGPALINAGFDPDVNFASQGEVVINNTLAAISTTNPDTIAAIFKRDFKLIPAGDLDRVIPEPSASLMCGLTLVGIAFCRRPS